MDFLTFWTLVSPKYQFLNHSHGRKKDHPQTEESGEVKNHEEGEPPHADENSDGSANGDYGTDWGVGSQGADPDFWTTYP